METAVQLTNSRLDWPYSSSTNLPLGLSVVRVRYSHEAADGVVVQPASMRAPSVVRVRYSHEAADGVVVQPASMRAPQTMRRNCLVFIFFTFWAGRCFCVPRIRRRAV